MANDETQLIQIVDKRAGATVLAPQPDTSPTGLIKLALERGAAVADLGALLDLQLRWEANEARKAYTAAMAAFKSSGPITITKDGEVDFKTDKGRTHYRHATLANVLREVTPRLAAHGLSVAWVTKQDPKGGDITVDCVVTHLGGHNEVVTLTAPPDRSGNKNAIQAVASTVTYLERYTVLAALGLSTEDEADDDAGGGSKTRQQAEERREEPDNRSVGTRAQKAIYRYQSALGIDQAALESSLGVPVTAWTDAEYERLGAIWSAVSELQASERPTRAREMLERGREPGEEG